MTAIFYALGYLSGAFTLYVLYNIWREVRFTKNPPTRRHHG